MRYDSCLRLEVPTRLELKVESKKYKSPRVESSRVVGSTVPIDGKYRSGKVSGISWDSENPHPSNRGAKTCIELTDDAVIGSRGIRDVVAIRSVPICNI
jgi:hypothetical protein